MLVDGRRHWPVRQAATSVPDNYKREYAVGAETTPVRLSYEALLELKRLNTPSVYNGWEAITKKDRAKGHFNMEEVHDYMPQMGPMVGYAVTVVIEPTNPSHTKENPNAWGAYRRYVADAPGPKIVVVQAGQAELRRRLLG